MTDWIAKAKARRDVYDRQGAYLTDAQAATVAEAYPEWAEGISITQEMIDKGLSRYRRGKQLYKTNTPHTTQEGWEPENVPAVWTPIDLEHTGTIDDPIPAVSGMYYTYFCYYLDPEDGNTYLCQFGDTQTTGTVQLFYLPHQAPTYFKLAS